MSSDLARALSALGIDPTLANEGFRAAHPFVVAVSLAMRGFRVMPSNNLKIPMLKDWQERASADPARLMRRQKQFCPPCWSITTGRANRFIAIDVDGERGRETLAKLEVVLGPLPETWRVVSGREGGGVHIWLACPPGADDLRNQQPVVVYGVRYAGIDIRGWHGHVVIPGSLHKSGRRYKWAEGCAPDEIELAECPPEWWAWLPKKEFAEGGQTRRSPSTRRAAPKIAREHDPASFKIGDGEGFGGFNRPIFATVCSFFRRFGADADAEDLKDALKYRIQHAPRDAGRSLEDVQRYASDSYLDAEISSARTLVQSE